jgi:hypothetical protein
MKISTRATTMTRVEELWREIATQSGRTGLFRRVDETHPLDLYAGIDHQGKRVLMLVTNDTPPILPPTGIVEVACNQRDDENWAIIVQLARPDFDELFGRLCQDLIDSTREATPEHGGDVLLSRLGRWRRLLEVGHRQTLSEAELRGLIGELWFLQTVALPRAGADAAVKGWLGPLAAPHDFLLGASLIEIKTCVPGSDDVTIASLQQLDPGGEPLYLGVVRLASATSTTPDAFSTQALVTRIRHDIEASQAASTEFELRLAETGYADGEEYARAWYHVSGVRYFHIRDDFPRLVSASVPAGIRDVTYTVDLRSCTAFEGEFSTRQV